MRVITSEENMKSRLFSSNAVIATFVLILIACALPGIAAAQSQPAAKPAATGPKAFDTPQQAAEALIKAAGDYDVPDLMAIFGPDGEDFIESADPVRDKNNGVAFAKEAATKNSIEVAKSNPNRATIIVGDEGWPFPVPLVKKNGKWYFNAKEGRQEILYRRIGANELDAITVCRGYVEAQKEYASEIHDDSGVNQYAQKIFSSPGQAGRLVLEECGRLIGRTDWRGRGQGAGGRLYAHGKGGFHGYYFKILKGQGPAAPMGKLDYVIEGIMIGGFALVAVPAEYRVTGVKTFIVSNNGIVYQKDLGPDSVNIVKNMELYNPDKTWQPTNDEWPQSVAVAKP